MRDQVIGSVPAAHTRARGLHTDLAHGGPVIVTVTADRNGQALSLLPGKAGGVGRHPTLLKLVRAQDIARRPERYSFPYYLLTGH